MIDLDHFPTNETALDMMSMISPIYDRSYVGKWIFEVMGFQLGYATGAIEKTFLEANIDTSDEMLCYWEQLYGIQTNWALSLEERRRKLRQLRGYTRPMNPARIEQIISEITGRDVIVRENTAPHTYEVCIQDGDGDVDYDAVWETIYEIKQSQKHVDIVFEIHTGIKIRADPEEVVFPYNMAGPAIKAGTRPRINTAGKITDVDIRLSPQGRSGSFPYIVSGTRPYINIPGHIDDEILKIISDQAVQVFSYVLSGTRPNVNIVGKADDSEIALSPAGEEGVFPYIPAGEIKAGTYPEPNFSHIPVDVAITAKPDLTIATYRYVPANEYMATGTYPAVNMGYVPVNTALQVHPDAEAETIPYISAGGNVKAGTHPDIASAAAVTDGCLETWAATKNQFYPYTSTGTKPDTSVIFVPGGAGIQMDAEAMEEMFQYIPANGFVKAGTKTHTSMERSADVPGISGNVDGKSFGVAYKKCGQKKL